MSKRVLEVVVKVKDEASKGLDSFASKLGISTDKFKNMSKTAVAAGVAIAAALVAIGKAALDVINDVAALGDTFDKMSKRTGESVDTLARWTYSSELAGGSASTVEQSFRKLSKAMFDASKGLKTQSDAFALLGIEINDADGELRDVNDVMLDLATTFENSTNRTETMAVAQDVLGRGALQMVAILEQGKEALAAQGDEFERLRDPMSVISTKSAELVDSQLRMKTATDGVKASFSEGLMPVLTEFNNTLASVVGRIRLIDDFFHQFDVDMSQLSDGTEDAAIKLTEFDYQLKAMAEDAKVANDAVKDFSMDDFVNDDHVDNMLAYAEAVDELAVGMNNLISGIDAAPNIEADTTAADQKFEALTNEIVLLEDIIALEEEKAAQLSTTSEAEDERLANQNEQLRTAGELADEHIAQLEAMAEAEAVLNEGVMQVVDSMEGLLASTIKAMSQGELKAIKFGRVLSGAVVDALSRVIAKMIIIKALDIFSGGLISMFGIKDGGTVPGYAAGGAIGGGYAIPDGPRGMDSIPMMGMPGEHVIDRTLSQRLAGFLNAQDSAAMVSPSQLVSGGAGGVSVSMNIARPVGHLDLLDLGEATVVVARKVAEANL